MNSEYLRLFKRNLIDRENLNLITHYKHPLGFYFYLLESYNGFSVRLHIWPQEIEDRSPLEPNFPIHDHQWAFESFILTGELENIIYESSRSCTGTFAKYLIKYFPNKSGANIVKQVEKYDLKIKSQFIYSAGHTYSMREREIHQSIPSKLFTATLLFASLSDTKDPIVYGDINGADSYLVNRMANSDVVLAEKYLSKLKDILNDDVNV